MDEPKLRFLKPVLDQYMPYFVPFYLVYFLISLVTLHLIYADIFGIQSVEFTSMALGTWIGVGLFVLLIKWLC